MFLVLFTVQVPAPDPNLVPVPVLVPAPGLVLVLVPAPAPDLVPVPVLVLVLILAHAQFPPVRALVPATQFWDWFLQNDSRESIPGNCGFMFLPLGD